MTSLVGCPGARRESARRGRTVSPGSLEFYAHEWFARDADGIREFLKMGRSELAVMTATEDPGAIHELLPVLNEMLGSSDIRVTAAIRDYLAEHSTHAGSQHLHKAI